MNSLQKRLHPDKTTPLQDSSVGNETNASKHRKPIMQPEPYKPPSGKYSGGLESLDEVISTFILRCDEWKSCDCSEARGDGYWRNSVA